MATQANKLLSLSRKGRGRRSSLGKVGSGREEEMSRREEEREGGGRRFVRSEHRRGAKGLRWELNLSADENGAFAAADKHRFHRASTLAANKPKCEAGQQWISSIFVVGNSM